MDRGGAAGRANRVTHLSVPRSGALEDAEGALKIDPRFSKAWVRKGNCQLASKVRRCSTCAALCLTFAPTRRVSMPPPLLL